jgi:hypothetical protein
MLRKQRKRVTTVLNDLLACPRCDKALDAVSAGWRCAGCNVEFPDLAGIPWLFAEPAATRSEWRQRLDFSLRRLEHDLQRLDQTLAAQTELLPLTRERLEHIKHAVADHAQRLKALLEPLRDHESTTSYETYLALRTRLPPDQGLTTYYPNLHRDWCWGAEENAAALALLAPGFQTLGEAPKILVLGSGAGRLAYDVHTQHSPALTVALDFNPLFQLAVQKIAAGDSLELYEFPLAPRSWCDHAVLRELSAPAAAQGELQLILADALRAPFKDASFDVVITPWLIDILPEDFATLCPRINRLLAPAGCWLNIGSLYFNQAGPDKQYSPDECAALIKAAGFAAPTFAEATIPYMCSPASRHGRREAVLAWHTAKTGKAKRPARYEALPDWLVKGTEPVPLLDEFRVQATTTRIYAGLMALIDGRRTLKDMARVLVSRRVMAEADAEPAIRQFLTKMYNDSQRAKRL